MCEKSKLSGYYTLHVVKKYALLKTNLRYYQYRVFLFIFRFEIPLVVYVVKITL